MANATKTKNGTNKSYATHKSHCSPPPTTPGHAANHPGAAMKAGHKVRLDDVCGISSALIDPRQTQYLQLPHVGGANIESMTGKLIDLKTAEEEGLKSGKFLFDDQMVLYSKIRPYLTKVARPNFRGVCSADIYPLSPNDGQLDRNFLFHLLLTPTFTDYAITGSARAGMPKVNRDHLFAFQFHLPALSEQRRIVGILDETLKGLATAKANAEQNLQNACALFESHLQAVFTQRGDGWVEKPLSELCDIEHGFAFKSEFFTSEGDYVLLTPGNYYESGGYRDRGDKQKYFTSEIPPDFVLSEGDLLVAMTEQAAGLLGSPVLVPESDKFLHNQRLGLVTKKSGVPWTNEFFFHVFNTQAVRKEIHDSATGVKVRHTSPTKMGNVVVSFPTVLSEQRVIVVTLKDLREETQRLESLYQRKLAALDELKQSLLHRAFSGQL